MVLQIARRCWKQHKSKITSDLLEANKKDDRAKTILDVRPSNVLNDEEWDDFVKERFSPSYQATREKFKVMRKNKKLLHTMSRKGYACTEDEMITEKGSSEEVTRVGVWRLGHVKKNGEPVNEDVSSKLEETKKCTTKNPTTNNIKDDVLAKILGPERHGRVRGPGAGATLSRIEFQN
ncbi:hypothetical protein Sjap_002620 [Stephania japonica]|uniref:Uncharacterized protein n=1 Tax=Stephania japonica TaxID=461633 RepID=A0AAP0PUB2_9MAGN